MKPLPEDAETVVAAALEVPAGTERQQFIVEACSKSPALMAEVELLLKRRQSPEGGLAHDRTPNVGLGMGSTLAVDEHTIAQSFQARGFTLIRKLGAGGLGSVYLARDEKLQRNVALKILHRPTASGVRQRVLQEARAAASLRHAGIVTIHAVLDDADPPAIVMEVVDGYAFDQFSKELSFQQRAGLLQQVARALGFAHRHGLIHRDLKPDNVLVGPDFQPRILDFGLAMPADQAHRARAGFEGSPAYASPEQADGKPLSAATDVFSFGTMMFKVLTGRMPFAGKNTDEVLQSIRTSQPPFLRDLAIGVPDDLQAICLACLSSNPADRPSAEDVALDLGRFLAGEPIHLKPRLYDDLLRQRISEQGKEAYAWQRQSMISVEERDSLEVVHRRLLADEDHWIIDARRITPTQAVLYGGTWLVVVATLLLVWFLREELEPAWRLGIPACVSGFLLLMGFTAHQRRELLAAATFLAGATLAIAPSTLAFLAELKWLAVPADQVGNQLFKDVFSNRQLLASSLLALGVSVFGLWRMKMTGFAWTTALLAVTTYFSLLLLFDWQKQDLEIMALWFLPLVSVEGIAIAFERLGRVRWTLPFHWIALITLVVGLDVMASEGALFKWLGIQDPNWPYVGGYRRMAFSFSLNGILFLGLMLLGERQASLDLRRAARILEVLGVLHTLSPLFMNAMSHRSDSRVSVDAVLYLSAACALVAAALARSRWRLLVAGLMGLGLGCYLVVELELFLSRKIFIGAVGLGGLAIALAAFNRLRRIPRGLVRDLKADKDSTQACSKETAGASTTP